MKLNDIFYEEQYDEAYQFVCSHENTQIIEVEPVDGQRKFKIVSIAEDMLHAELESQIQELKDQLSATDYKVLKYLEGHLAEQEFTQIKAQRQQWRDRINELEEELK